MGSLVYRNEIDGIRAIAVLAVLVFHLDSRLLPGGFIGVDVFFVISGYLITGIICTESESGSFSVSRFYQRRIARIFPAYLAVILFVLLVSSVVYSPQDFASAGALATASALSLTNMKLMLQGNYFDASEDAQPLLHFWSLAVEEQFYFVFPSIICISRYFGFGFRWLSGLLLVLASASFVSCVYSTYVAPAWAFYMLPSRAWELIIGALVAIGFNGISSISLVLRQVASYLGLLLVAASVFLLSDHHRFPGYVAMFPVLGCALMLAGLNNASGFVYQFLSHRIPVFLGKLSYSLYLWHWPVFCFADYALFASDSILRGVVKIALTIVFAVCSYSFLEAPLRAYLSQAKKRSLAFTCFFSGVVIVAVAGLYVRQENYIDSDVGRSLVGGVVINASRSEPIIVLMGDSNASMYGAAMKSVARNTNCRVQVLSVAAGDPFPPSVLYSNSLEYIKEVRPLITIFVASWADKIQGNRDKVEFLVNELLQCSEHVLLITQPPRLPVEGSRASIREHGFKPLFEDSGYSAVRYLSNGIVGSMQSSRVHVIDIEKIFVADDGSIRFVNASGLQNYHDRGHLSGYGAQPVAKLISDKISELQRQRGYE